MNLHYMSALLVKKRRLGLRISIFALFSALSFALHAAVSDPVGIRCESDGLEWLTVRGPEILFRADFSDARRFSAVLTVADTAGAAGNEFELSPSGDSAVVVVPAKEGRRKLRYSFVYRDASGNVLGEDSGVVYVVPDFSEPVDIRIDRTSREWGRVPDSTLLAYSVDWAPFQGTGAAYAVSCGEDSLSEDCMGTSGWIEWNVKKFPFKGKVLHAVLAIDGECPWAYNVDLKTICAFAVIIR